MKSRSGLDLAIAGTGNIKNVYFWNNKQCDNCDLDLHDLIIQPDPLGKLHYQKRPPITTRITLTGRTAQG